MPKERLKHACEKDGRILPMLLPANGVYFEGILAEGLLRMYEVRFHTEAKSFDEGFTGALSGSEEGQNS